MSAVDLELCSGPWQNHGYDERWGRVELADAMNAVRGYSKTQGHYLEYRDCNEYAESMSMVADALGYLPYAGPGQRQQLTDAIESVRIALGMDRVDIENEDWAVRMRTDPRWVAA